MRKLDSIQIRDPFILADEASGLYFLFGSTDSDIWRGSARGFECYSSPDLENWSEAIPAFRPPEGFWADQQFWAPEVHRIDGRYVMLATFSDGVRRGTQALLADSPAGPYSPVGDAPLTPGGWSCLDGTLYMDDRGRPWLIFCREWTDVGDGEILAAPIRPDFAALEEDPVLLFRASAAPWSREYVPRDGHAPGWITDGPFVIPVGEGLGMLWSSLGERGYAMGFATSESGILGPWSQHPSPIWSLDGGHGMIFATFAGEDRLVFHRPNNTPMERATLHPLRIRDGRMELVADEN